MRVNRRWAMGYGHWGKPCTASLNRDEGDTGDKSRCWANKQHHNLILPLPGQPSAGVPGPMSQDPGYWKTTWNLEHGTFSIPPTAFFTPYVLRPTHCFLQTSHTSEPTFLSLRSHPAWLDLPVFWRPLVPWLFWPLQWRSPWKGS